MYVLLIRSYLLIILKLSINEKDITKMKWYQKLTLTIFAVLCCFSFTMCNKDDISDSASNDASSKQNSTKPEIQTTNQTEINTTNITIIVESEEPAPPEYFDDVVFVGDSISESLRRYTSWLKDEQNIDYFGKAQFLTAASFGIYNALVGECLPVYKGERMPIEDNIVQMDVKKVYILLGLNDVARFSCEENIQNYKELINRILSKKPNLDIIIQSVTPLTRHEESLQYVNFDRAHVKTLNEALEKMADENNFYFINVASAVMDDEGFLPNEYSYDGTCHMTYEALELWINYMRTHTLKSVDVEI